MSGVDLCFAFLLYQEMKSINFVNSLVYRVLVACSKC